MEEPSTAEIIRDIQADVRYLVSRQDLFVTQEQRASDQKVAELQHEALKGRVMELEEDKKSVRRMVLSAFVLPLVVILVAYILGVKP